MGEKKHKQNGPQNPGTIPRNLCLCVFLSVGFFAPNLQVQMPQGRSLASASGSGQAIDLCFERSPFK